MNAELFPKEAQGVLSSVAAAFNWLCAFVVSKFSSDGEEEIKSSGLYFLIGVICAVGAVFVILAVPETKGKSPEDMKKYFMGVKQEGSESGKYKHLARSIKYYVFNHFSSIVQYRVNNVL